MQIRFPNISATCFSNIFLALTVVTLPLMTTSLTGVAFEVHETRKQCFGAVNADLLPKYFFLPKLRISDGSFWFPCVNNHENLS